LLLGILGHDLRNPLGTISMAGVLLPRLGLLNEKQAGLAATIATSSDRMARIISDLLDLTRSRQGTGLPVDPQPMDLGELAVQMVAEAKTQTPDRDIELQIVGDVDGDWDRTRLGQMFSNLLGNAVQYGDKTKPIKLVVEGSGHSVSVVINNDGPPIPAGQLATLFNSFTRGAEPATDDVGSNLGLGLFITSEIVKSHLGTIEVSSSELAGTSFSVRLPRHVDGRLR